MRLTRPVLLIGLSLARTLAVAATLVHTLSADFVAAEGVNSNISTAGDQLTLSTLNHTESNLAGTYSWFRSRTDFGATEYRLETEKLDGTVFGLADVCLDAAATSLSDADQVVVNGNTYTAGPHTTNLGANEASVPGGSRRTLGSRVVGSVAARSSAGMS